MKLVIMIPCYNEEETLPATLRDIPRSIPGIDTIELLVVDDGCTDRTVEVARTFGVHWVARHVRNRGLAAAFQTGLDACLHVGADIIVNTDGDNQYPQADIPRLIEPILRGEAEIVVGDRQTGTIAHFSPAKKVLQAFGSWVMRQASGTSVPDAPSGFRAYSREAALRLNVITQYTYTLETLIQAGKKNLAVKHIAVRTNPQLRASRLMRGPWDYVKKQSATIVRLYALYEPLKVFVYLGLFFLALGAIPMLRFVYFYFALGQLGTRYVQSLIIGSMLIMIGVLIIAIGLLADLIASSRRLTEDILYRVKKLELREQAPNGLATEARALLPDRTADQPEYAAPRHGPGSPVARDD
jgi:glycosyltransferase involved in cell wall biosynthesis